jgi:sec-independent protein translocase protein TatC
MAVEPLPPPAVEEEEEGGGPVKPFLEHLEDLRWTIIKVVSALLISMIVCLVAGNRLFHLLYRPLIKAAELKTETNSVVAVRFGDAILGHVSLDVFGTNAWTGERPQALMLKPLPVDGTNWMMTLVPDTNAPVQAENPGLVVVKGYGPLSPIVVALKIALYGGLSLAAPFVMLFIGQFVLPALKRHEKRFIYRAVGVGVGLFLIGVVFAYFVIMKITILMTVEFSHWMGMGADEWRADDYVDFVLKMMLAVGLAFQLPVVLLTLVKIGIVDYQTLTKNRAYFIVGNMVVCAFVTPSGDPFTMLLLAGPVQILYEISVIIARVWWKREQRELAELEAAT